MHESFEMRADGRETMKHAVFIAVGGDFVQAASNDRTVAARNVGGGLNIAG
jgi:hypothetical protein